MAGVSPELLGRLVDDHAAALVLYAWQWCNAPEDIVQEAFLKLVRQKSVPANPLGWLYRVVRNGALSAARSTRRRRHHETAAAGRAPAWFVAESPGLDADAATAALQQLPVEQREIIVAHLWGGLNFEQIAELVGTSPSSAHRWYMTGLTRLRERLGVPCPSKPPIRN